MLHSYLFPSASQYCNLRYTQMFTNITHVSEIANGKYFTRSDILPFLNIWVTKADIHSCLYQEIVKMNGC